MPSIEYLVAVLFKDYLLNERCWFGWTTCSAGAYQGARDTSEWVRVERNLNARFPDVLATASSGWIDSKVARIDPALEDMIALELCDKMVHLLFPD